MATVIHKLGDSRQLPDQQEMMLPPLSVTKWKRVSRLQCESEMSLDHQEAEGRPGSRCQVLDEKAEPKGDECPSGC